MLVNSNPNRNKCISGINPGNNSDLAIPIYWRKINKPFSGCRSGLSCASFHLHHDAHTGMPGCNSPP